MNKALALNVLAKDKKWEIRGGVCPSVKINFSTGPSGGPDS